MSRRARAAVLLGAACLAGAAPAAGFSPDVNYALECQGCHLADGTATAGSVPALAGSVGRFLRVKGGREYLAQVPGVAQAPLDDAALAALLNWVLGRFGGADVPRDFPPYTAAEVATLRRAPLTDVEQVRRRLLAQLAPVAAD
jgi:hypothetical protein